MRVRLLLLLSLYTIMPGSAFPEQAPISIVVPSADGARVPGRACVSGYAPAGVSDLIIVVHPQFGQYFVQPLSHLDADGHFQGEVYVGEEGRGKNDNAEFVIGVFAGLGNDQEFAPGEAKNSWPEATYASRLVTVVRDDGAGDGCSYQQRAATPTHPRDTGAGQQVGSEASTPTQPLNAEQAPAPVMKTAPIAGSSESASGRQAPVPPLLSRARWGSIRRTLSEVLVVALCLMLPLFVSLAAFPRRAAVGAGRVIGWIRPYRTWLVSSAKSLAQSVCSLWFNLKARWVKWSEPIWNARGFRGNLRNFAISFMLVPLLGAAGFAALGSDAVVLQKGLDALFGIEEPASGAPVSSGAFSDNALPIQPIPNEHPSALPIGSHFGEMVNVIAGEYLRAFLGVIKSPMGILSMALAGLQGTLGLVIIWGLDRKQVAELGIRRGRLSRFFLTIVFILFTVALSAIAAIRGHDLNQTDWPIWSMAVSALLAFLMPWAIIVTWHYALESAGDVLGVAQSILLLIGMTMIGFAAIASWTAACLFVIAWIGIGFACCAVFCFLVYVFLRVAEIEGDFACKLLKAIWPNSHVDRRLAAVPASIVVCLLVTAYFLLERTFQ